jgi:hypothetical protein
MRPVKVNVLFEPEGEMAKVAIVALIPPSCKFFGYDPAATRNASKQSGGSKKVTDFSVKHHKSCLHVQSG